MNKFHFLCMLLKADEIKRMQVQTKTNVKEIQVKKTEYRK